MNTMPGLPGSDGNDIIRSFLILLGKRGWNVEFKRSINTESHLLYPCVVFTVQRV